MPEEKKLTKAQTRIWEDVEVSRKRTGCTCPIEAGMDYRALRPLGAGCTDFPPNYKLGDEGNFGYVCPSLDLYRRLVGYPPMDLDGNEREAA